MQLVSLLLVQGCQTACVGRTCAAWRGLAMLFETGAATATMSCSCYRDNTCAPLSCPSCCWRCGAMRRAPLLGSSPHRGACAARSLRAPPGSHCERDASAVRQQRQLTRLGAVRCRWRRQGRRTRRAPGWQRWRPAWRAPSRTQSAPWRSARSWRTASWPRRMRSRCCPATVTAGLQASCM
jgi:hypothetical protein